MTSTRGGRRCWRRRCSARRWPPTCPGASGDVARIAGSSPSPANVDPSREASRQSRKVRLVLGRVHLSPGTIGGARPLRECAPQVLRLRRTLRLETDVNSSWDEFHSTALAPEQAHISHELRDRHLRRGMLTTWSTVRPTGSEDKPPRKPSSQPVGQTHEDNGLREESTDGSRREYTQDGKSSGNGRKRARRAATGRRAKRGPPVPGCTAPGRSHHESSLDPHSDQGPSPRAVVETDLVIRDVLLGKNGPRVDFGLEGIGYFH